MRWVLVGIGVSLTSLLAVAAQADEEPGTGERVLTGVISGLLGVPQQPPDEAYAAQERERLASLLQSGEYATSRQSEPIDLMVYGIPLTHVSHVYTAKPIAPSQRLRQPLGP